MSKKLEVDRTYQQTFGKLFRHPHGVADLVTEFSISSANVERPHAIAITRHDLSCILLMWKRLGGAFSISGNQSKAPWAVADCQRGSDAGVRGDQASLKASDTGSILPSWAQYSQNRTDRKPNLENRLNEDSRQNCESKTMRHCAMQVNMLV